MALPSDFQGQLEHNNSSDKHLNFLFHSCFNKNLNQNFKTDLFIIRDSSILTKSALLDYKGYEILICMY